MANSKIGKDIIINYMVPSYQHYCISCIFEQFKSCLIPAKLDQKETFVMKASQGSSVCSLVQLQMAGSNLIQGILFF